MVSCIYLYGIKLWRKTKCEGLDKEMVITNPLHCYWRELKQNCSHGKTIFSSSHSLIDISHGGEIFFSFRTHLLLVGDVSVSMVELAVTGIVLKLLSV